MRIFGPLILFVSLFQVSYAAFDPVDSYFIACGSPQNVTYLGRSYTPDSPTSSFSFKTQNSFEVTSNTTALSPIYQSARIFTTNASYHFDIKQEGRHWVRLYFSPVPNSGHDLSSATVTVFANTFVLLNEFTFKNYNTPYIFKEYSVIVTSDHLSLTFIPSNNSLAFVNAIEVVSVPNELIPDKAIALSPTAPASGLSGLAFETFYRLNMGGSLISGQTDILGRTWQNDAKFLLVNSSVMSVSISPASIIFKPPITPIIAPSLVYSTGQTLKDSNVSDGNSNITWVLPADPNFTYWIRVHFCNIVSKNLNEFVFSFYINSEIALSNFDIWNEPHGLFVPYFKDFTSNLSTNSNPLTVSVVPSANSKGIINGLEVFKISLPKKPSKKSKLGLILGCVAGGLALLVLFVCGYFFFRTRISHFLTKKSTASPKSETASGISLAPLNLGRTFSFQELMAATNEFDGSLVIGSGGFGWVYKGTIDDGTIVAVKRGNPRYEEGLAEFRTEIEVLSNLHHGHVVSLVGYCDEQTEKILVYEYMANGDLRSHLYGTDLPSLSWKQRLEICIGSAKGLYYLHSEAIPNIIHRDVKTPNILLDENFVAKVADFGISKAVSNIDQTHVSTTVKGSFGYLDPEYFITQKLTRKSDVYSFGVVLMEVLCARAVMNPALPREQVNLVEWAMDWQKNDMLDQIMDQNLVGNVNIASFKKIGETAEICLAENGDDRPSMGEVLLNLEHALQLMESDDSDDNSIREVGASSSAFGNI